MQCTFKKEHLFGTTTRLPGMEILVNVYMIMIYSICHMFIHHLGSFVFDNLLHKQEASNPISPSPFTKIRQD
jgi:hypothetical protein